MPDQLLPCVNCIVLSRCKATAEYYIDYYKEMFSEYPRFTRVDRNRYDLCLDKETCLELTRKCSLLEMYLYDKETRNGFMAHTINLFRMWCAMRYLRSKHNQISDISNKGIP